jgi:predicted amidohydrolase
VSLRVCLAQLDSRGDQTREARLAEVTQLVAGIDAELVILPELWLTDFFAFERYQEEAEPLNGATVSALGQAARRAGVWLVGGTLIERGAGGALHNTAVVLGPDGELAGAYRKIHLFGFGAREPELLSAGAAPCLLQLAGAQVGLSICYDLRFPELYRLLGARGAQLLVVPAAWPAVRREHWRLLLAARAVENQAFVLGCCAVGEHHGVRLAADSQVRSPSGELLARAGESEQLLYAELDLSALERLRQEFPVLADRRLKISEDEFERV